MLIKFLTAILSIAIVINCNYYYNLPVFNIECENYTFYLYDNSSNAKIITVMGDNAKRIKKTLKDIKGESLFLSCNDYQKNSIIKDIVKIKKAKFVFSERVDGIINDYYYSNLIPYNVVLKGKKVNMHLSIKDDCINVGSPIIFGSF